MQLYGLSEAPVRDKSLKTLIPYQARSPRETTPESLEQQ
jgi:hypothetical protein